jgi:DNA modification methylase
MNKKYKKEVISYGDCKAELYNGDCLEVMDYLIFNNIKVDSIICDPPYG